MNARLRLAAYMAYVSTTKEKIVSSRDIGRATGIHPTQVRRDLARLGSMGKRGEGYQTAVLASAIGEDLRPELEEIMEEAENLSRLLKSVMRVCSRMAS